MSYWKPPSYWSKVSPQQPASYIIYIDDLGYICAKNGETGKIDYRDTDAATVINNAVAQLELGGKVVLKRDLYLITDTITIENHGIEFCMETMWRGTKESTETMKVGLKLADNVNKNVLLIEGRKCHVHDLYIDVNKDNNTAAVSGIYAASDGALDLHLSHVYIFNSVYYGIVWLGGAGYAEGVYVEYSNRGWYIGGTRNVFVQCGAYATQEEYPSFILDLNAHQNALLGCVAANGLQGFVINGNRNRIIGCVAQEINQFGLKLAGAKNNVIMGNTFYNVGKTGTDDAIILLSRDSTHSTHNIIMGNRIYSDASVKPRYGINEEDANQDYNVIVGNIITDYGTGAINSLGTNDVVANNIT